MKKLTAIIVMALVLTVGGVYASFTYAQGTAIEATESVDTSIAGKTTETEKGTISIVSDFTIHVDDINKNLKTGFTTSGSTIIKFTPNTGADADVVKNGIKLKLVIEIKNGNSYKGTDIFTLKNYTEGGIVLNDGNKVIGEIEVNLADYIGVSEISLPTAEEYDAYKTALEATQITFTVSEAA